MHRAAARRAQPEGICPHRITAGAPTLSIDHRPATWQQPYSMPGPHRAL